MNEAYTAVGTRPLRARVREQVRNGHWEAAELSLRSLVEALPQDVPAWMDLASVVARQGRWKDSSLPLLQAVQFLPRHVPVVLALIHELMERGEVVATRRCLAFLQQAPEPPADLLRIMAGLRFMLGEYQSSKDLLERAFAAGLDDADSHYTHGMLRSFLGDIDGACREMETILARWPHYSDGAVLLSNWHKHTQHTDLLEYAERQLGKSDRTKADEPTEAARAGLEYVRFRILDDLDRRDDAWEALVACNRRMNKLYPYAAADETELTETLLNLRVPATVSADQHAPRPPGPIPIFVVGTPRSGTTLLERILSAHSMVASAGEIIDFQRQLRNFTDVRPGQPKGLLTAIERSTEMNLEPLGERYLKQTQWRAGGKAFYVDKLPANIRMVPLIRRALPYARIVHLTRDPMDTCYSNFKRMFGSGSPYSYDMQSMAHFYREYARLVARWHRDLPDAMLDVSYAELVSKPELVVPRVLHYCGLPLEDSCLHPERNDQPSATPSNVQVREAIHQRGIGEWRRYESQLKPLHDALGALVHEA